MLTHPPEVHEPPRPLGRNILAKLTSVMGNLKIGEKDFILAVLWAQNQPNQCRPGSGGSNDA